MASLSSLTLGATGQPNGALNELAPLQAVPSLACLRLWAMHTQLPRMDALTRLTRLELEHVTLLTPSEGAGRFGARGLRELAVSRCATRACTLAEALGGFTGLPALEALDLTQALGHRGFKVVAARHTVAHVAAAAARVAPEGLDALTALTRLALAGNGMQVLRADALARLCRLRELDLNNNPLLPRGFAALHHLCARLPGLRIQYAGGRVLTGVNLGGQGASC